jgi:alkanesulfonate monooxygenase SsuD/methylene tetrahydromethanopterin reductase-like flavin-dependent oxidoreductase (luciferase family)
MTNASGRELPALNLTAEPGQRLATLELAREIERRGFSGISVASPFGTIGQCMGLAFGTQRISFASAIAPIYAQTVDEFAQSAAYLHEVSAGRFQFGIGIAHGPSYVRMGVTRNAGKIPGTQAQHW